MLQGLSYVPLLHLRLAEMRAYQELPEISKAAILPLVRLRPWLNSKSMTKAYERVAESIGLGSFGFDLDPTKFSPNDERSSYVEFARLFDNSNGYSTYYDAVRSIETAIPVMRTTRNSFLNLDEQLAHVSSIGRGTFVRVDVPNPNNYLDVAREVKARNISNVVFILDCGWRTDVLNRAAQCIGLANSLLDIKDDFEVVVAGSSFPDSFNNLGTRFGFPIAERLLFQEVRRQLNRGQIYYGDWGSTRPPTEPVPMTNVPRIDIALSNSWECWRSDGESYEEVADRVVNDNLWTGDISLWGQYMIQSTANGTEPAIKSPATAAAVRINLHLNTQANFDNPTALDLGDEPVGDDL